jgi:hypothetical protein
LSLGVGAAGARAAIVAAFRSDMPAAQARLAAKSRLVETTCGPVEVAESGSGPPVLVVHGTGGGASGDQSRQRSRHDRRLHSVSDGTRSGHRVPLSAWWLWSRQYGELASVTSGRSGFASMRVSVVLGASG